VAIVLQDVCVRTNEKEETMTKAHATTKRAETQGAHIDSADFLKEIVRTALQEFLGAEITEYIGAEPYERSEGRTGQRNGYKPRLLKTRVGTLELSVPKSRDGQFQTALFERFQRSERAFTLALMRMYQDGVSTRKVTDITETLCGTSFSASTVSDLCKALDDQVSAWKERDLSAHRYPYLFVDALYENIRRGGVVISSGVLIVSAVRDDGRREILDVVVADTESVSTYSELFCSLKSRGLDGVLLVTSDAHAGLKAAIARYFQGAAWQRCQVHFMRDMCAKVSFKHRKALSQDLLAIFACTKKRQALSKAGEVALAWREISAKVAEAIEEDIEQCLSVLAFPEEHRRRLRTNNSLERLNEEIRRRTRVIRIFPDEASALRLIGALCIEQSEQWSCGRIYLDMNLADISEKIDVTALEIPEIRKAG